MKPNIDALPTIDETILPSRDITRVDFWGYVFSLYPIIAGWNKCRDSLVADIRRTTPQDEKPEVTHQSILRAYDEKCERLFQNKPPHIQEAEMIAITRRTNARRMAKGLKPFPIRPRFVENDADETDPNALTWDAEKCRAVRVNKPTNEWSF